MTSSNAAQTLEEQLQVLLEFLGYFQCNHRIAPAEQTDPRDLASRKSPTPRVGRANRYSSDVEDHFPLRHHR